MKHFLLICLSTVSFFSYSSQYSKKVAIQYLSNELTLLHVQGFEINSPEHKKMLANYRLIIDIPMDRKDKEECFAMVNRARQENRSAIELVDWSKSYYDSRKVRYIR